MRKNWLLGIYVLFLQGTLCAFTNPEWSIAKSLWNKQAQTLDVFLEVSPESQKKIFTNFEKLSLQVNEDSTLIFRLHSIFKGYITGLPELSVFPQKILILVDHGRQAQPHVEHFEYLTKRIIGQYAKRQVVDLAYFSNESSSIAPVIDEKIDVISTSLKGQISISKTSHFAKVFLHLKAHFRNYDKIFLITNGVETSSPAFRMLNQSWLIDNQIFGNTQIIPLGISESLVPSFFEFIEDLNVFGIQRNNYSDIPIPNNESYEPAADPNYLTLRFKLTSHHPWRRKAGNIVISYSPTTQTTSSIQKTSVLSNVLDPVLNNQFFTESDPIWTIAIVFTLLILMLYYFIPIYNRFHFKKNHVKNYIPTNEQSAAVDPLKLSPIKENDKIVFFKEQVMLLDSWKFVNKSDEPIGSVGSFTHFFEPKIKGDLFTPRQDRFRYLMPLFLGVILSGILALLNYLMSRNIGLHWSQLELKASLPYPLGELGFIHSTILLIVFVLGAYVIYSYQTHRKWPLQKGDLLNVTVALFGILLFQGVYAMMHYHLPETISLLLSHILMGFLISVLIIRPLSIKNWGLILSSIGWISFFSFLSFYVLPAHILGMNVVASISYMVSVLLFSSMYSIWISQLKSGLVHSESKPEKRTIDLGELLSSSEQITIGSHMNSDFPINIDDSVKNKVSAAIVKNSDGFKILSNEGAIYVNSIQIDGSKKLHKGDCISFDQSNSSEWVVTY